MPLTHLSLAAETKWSKVDTGAYAGTTAFAFICAAFYMFFFICLVVFQGGIMKQTGLCECVVVAALRCAYARATCLYDLTVRKA